MYVWRPEENSVELFLSFSTFMWVLGVELMSPDLHGNHFYLLNSVDGLSCFIFELTSKYKLK